MKMPRISKSVFKDQLIWMLIAGLLMGGVFPLFLQLLGVPAEYVTTPKFYAATITAGLLMGVLNFGLVHFVTRPALTQLVKGMEKVRHGLENRLNDRRQGMNNACLTVEDCMIHFHSRDELGQVAQAFNGLVQTLSDTQEVQQAYEVFSKKLAASLNLEALAEQVDRLLVRFNIAQASALYVLRGGELQMVSSRGIEDAAELAQHPLMNQVVQTLKPRHIQLPPDIRVEALLVSFKPQHVHMLPLLFQDVLVGTMIVAGTRPLNEKEETILATLIRGMGLAVRNAITHEEIQRIAVLDSLTGIYNRRFGMKRLHEEYSRAVRQNSPLSLLILDIDHFKKVNDTYGHTVGDLAIKRVVEVAKSALREGDILVRYGGEEFIAILPGADCEDALTVAERIRRQVEETRLEHDQQMIPLTVSIGIASWPEQMVESEQDLIELADKALYFAKENGRNRAVPARLIAKEDKEVKE